MMKKPKLLISACLLGQAVRYDAQSKPIDAARLQKLEENYQLVPACPECLGGLPTPRPAAEICAGQGRDVLLGSARVCTAAGDDVSAAFVQGAQHTLRLAQQQGCQQALLKANSPSCGKHRIYDGNFKQQLQTGSGVTASLLLQHGIQVWNEDESNGPGQSSTP